MLLFVMLCPKHKISDRLCGSVAPTKTTTPWCVDTTQEADLWGYNQQHLDATADPGLGKVCLTVTLGDL
jgi:hypothetical protein